MMLYLARQEACREQHRHAVILNRAGGLDQVNARTIYCLHAVQQAFAGSVHTGTLEELDSFSIIDLPRCESAMHLVKVYHQTDFNTIVKAGLLVHREWLDMDRTLRSKCRSGIRSSKPNRDAIVVHEA